MTKTPKNGEWVILPPSYEGGRFRTFRVARVTEQKVFPYTNSARESVYLSQVRFTVADEATAQKAIAMLADAVQELNSKVGSARKGYADRVAEIAAAFTTGDPE